MDDSHAEMKIKPHLKPRGSVVKKEDQKSSHQLHKLQIKFTCSTRQTLCLWNNKKTIRAHAKLESKSMHEGILGRQRSTVTHSEGKDTDS